MKPWRIYGREAETEQLERWCLENAAYGFKSGAVIGRRGVGKTRLLRDVRNRMRGRRPMALFEIPPPPAPDEREGMAEILREHIDAAASEPDISPLLVDFVPDVQSGDSLSVEIVRISRMIRHCLRKGAIVGVDEFHNARPFSMEYGFKLIIDAASDVDARWPGRLVVAGSHQQQLIDMIGNPRAPLYQRFMHKFRLRPLRAPALLEMAAEQGWLADPRRFLTLTTVYGGEPRLWERYHAELQARPTTEAGFSEWRRTFLIREAVRMQEDPEERWDWKGLVEVEPVARSILETVVTRNFRGTPKSIVAETCRPPDMGRAEWKNELDRCLAILESHLEMAAPVRVPGPAFLPSPKAEKIRIIAPSTLFQLLLRESPKLTAAADIVDTADQRLRMAEGFALERLTAEWLEAVPGVARVATNIQPGTVEIDVLALSAETKWVGMISCKRSAGKHDPADTERQFTDFLEEVRHRWEPPPGARVEKMLVSPLFDDTDRARLKASGFLLVDTRAMARKLGFDPGPLATQDPAPEPEPPSPAFGASAPEHAGPGTGETGFPEFAEP